MFSIEYLNHHENSYGGIAIKYNNVIIAKLYFVDPIKQCSNGETRICATISLRYIRASDEILGREKPETIFINDKTFNTTQQIQGQNMSLIEVLDYLIPTRSEAIIQAISHIFQVEPEDILSDSYRKKYIVNTPYLFKNFIKPSHPTRFYKYISLSTYFNMLIHKTFRMNSIVSQSDETESLYIGDLLCAEYETKKARGRETIRESHILISSFTNEPNNPIMWKEYGDNGKGVMLEFESIGGDILYPIQYIDEKSTKLKSLKEDILSLKKANIHLYFSEIDSMHRFIKNNKYEFEQEWRLVNEFEGELNNTIYSDNKNNSDIFACYHDFPFHQNIIPDLKMSLVSVTFGPNQRISNIPLLTERTLECFGDEVQVHDKT